jgi:large subunit ribosomal protein L25
MANEFSINAEVRELQGKGASRRLRRVDDRVPAILYGGQKDPVSLSIAQKDLRKALENEAFYSHILTINVNGVEEAAILKDLQRHPYRAYFLHADFQRVVKDQPIHVNVPLHFINEDTCKAVKTGGGLISHQMAEVEVICLPGDLPEFIEVDMTNVELEQILHLSDLKVPAGVKLAALQHGADHDLPVVAVHKPRGAKGDESAE